MKQTRRLFRVKQLTVINHWMISASVDLGLNVAVTRAFAVIPLLDLKVIDPARAAAIQKDVIMFLSANRHMGYLFFNPDCEGAEVIPAVFYVRRYADGFVADPVIHPSLDYSVYDVGSIIAAACSRETVHA